MAINVAQLAIQSGLAATSAPRDYQTHRDLGESTASAGFRAGSEFLTNTLFSIPTAITIPLVGAAVNGAYQGVRNYNGAIRRIATPFSQQFHHNQMTSHLQSFGLSHMGAEGALGNEASMMYGRYGRSY